MLKVFKRSLNNGKGIWSNFQTRSTTLKIPHTIPSPGLDYHSPLLIDETFQQAYNVLEQESEQIYNKLQDNANLDNKTKDKLLIEAEAKNPEVLYNLEYNNENLDITQPVYRNFLQKKWENYDLMILMQRLEQFKVIPDTLPTLQPKIDIKIKFPHITQGDLHRWIVPGEFLPSFLVKQPPTIKFEQFNNVNNDNKLFTVLLVNPDEPNLINNSFKTTLNFGIANLSLSLTNNCLDTAKYLDYENGKADFNIFKSYVPILPEVNAGNYQRCCLWVFEQSDKIDITSINDQDFNIREFVNTYNLNAVGAHMWRQKYDRAVNDVRSDYGLAPGKVFHRVRKPFPLTDN